jgi:drug/metabolite transporter (DMT)-like permease
VSDRSIALRFDLWRAPYVLLALSTFFWASSLVVARGVHDLVPPVAMAFWRWAGGLLLVLLAGGWRTSRRDWPVLRQNWRVLCVLAAFGVGAYNTLTYIGLRSTTAINASLLQSAMPLLILLCTFVLFRERPSLPQIGAVVVSLAGVLIIAAHGPWAALVSFSLNPGDVWILCALVIYAIYSTLLRHRPAVHPLSFLAATFAIGSTLLLPLELWEYSTGAVLHPTPVALVAVAYIATGPAFLAYLCYNRGVELIGANRAGQFMHLMPVYGTVLAVVFLGEVFQLYHALGIALIAGGLALASIRPRAQILR